IRSALAAGFSDDVAFPGACALSAAVRAIIDSSTSFVFIAGRFYSDEQPSDADENGRPHQHHSREADALEEKSSERGAAEQSCAPGEIVEAVRDAEGSNACLR